MVKSMFAAVAGLKSHQEKLNVIGNNIANCNTTAFKSASVTFQDAIYTTLKGSQGGTTENGQYGGQNPSQVGFGAQISGIFTDYTGGGYSPDSDPLHCMIDGTGFFLVGDFKEESIAIDDGELGNAGLQLTRVGTFAVDENGYLVDNNRRYIYGYKYDQNTGEFDYNSLGPLKLPDSVMKTITQEGSAECRTLGELETNFPGKYEVTSDGFVVDKKTKEYLMTEDKRKVKVDNTNNLIYGEDGILASFKLTSDFAVGAELTDIEAVFGNSYELLNETDNTGNVTGAFLIDKETGARVVVNGKQVHFTPDATDGNKLKLDEVVTLTKECGNLSQLPATGAIQFKNNNGTLQRSADGGGTWEDAKDANGNAIMVGDGDILVSQKAGDAVVIKKATSSATQQNVEDYVVNSYTIKSDGTIIGTTDDKMTITIGKIALAAVQNPGGLEKTAGYYYNIGENCGKVNVVQAGGTTGQITGNALEQSNVDLSNDFTSMITAQRGFQANSKIITVTDEMLEQLVNMKR